MINKSFEIEWFRAVERWKKKGIRDNAQKDGGYCVSKYTSFLSYPFLWLDSLLIRSIVLLSQKVSGAWVINASFTIYYVPLKYLGFVNA